MRADARYTRGMRRAPIVIAALALVACGRAHELSAALDGGRGADASELPGSYHGDAATPELPDALAGLDAGVGAGATRSGFVQLLRERDEARPGGITLSAYFGEALPSASDRWLFETGCVALEEEGPCRLIACSGEPSSAPAGDVGATWRDHHVDAFLLTDVAQIAGAVIDEYVGVTTLDVAAGEAISVVGTGDAVPAFTATVLEPAPVEAALPTRASRSTDVVVRWTPSSADEMDVFLRPIPDDRRIVVCTVPASDGAVTLPARLVAGTSPASQTGWLAFQSVSTTTVIAGDWAIDVYAADMFGVENVVPIEP